MHDCCKLECHCPEASQTDTNHLLIEGVAASTAFLRFHSRARAPAACEVVFSHMIHLLLHNMRKTCGH